MIRKYTDKRIGIVILLFLLLPLTGTGLYYHINKKSNMINVTGEGNNVFTNEFFKNIVEIEDIFRRLSIKDKDKLQVICQAFSKRSLTEIKERETDPTRIKLGHSVYRLNYSDGSYRFIAILANRIAVDNKTLYEASDEINGLNREQFK